MFSRKDFIVVAKILKDTNAPLGDIIKVANEFKESNSRFNRDVFFNACGVPSRLNS